MSRLDILVHGGCLSEHSARSLAEEIRHELPNWDITVKTAVPGDPDLSGVIVFPAFLLDGRVLATGVPRKDWLVERLRAWERGSDV